MAATRPLETFRFPPLKFSLTENHMNITCTRHVLLLLLTPFIFTDVKAIDHSEKITESIRKGNFDQVMSEVKEMSPATIEGSSAELNEYLMKLPQDKSIALSEIISAKMQQVYNLSDKAKLWKIANDVLKSGSIDAIVNLGKNTKLGAIKDSSDKGLLTWAVISGQNLDVLKALLEGECNVNEQDSGGNTPLIWLYLSGNENPKELADFLIKQGASTTIKNKIGISAEKLAMARSNK